MAAGPDRSESTLGGAPAPRPPSPGHRSRALRSGGMSLANRTPPTDAEYAEYRTRYRNWGKWGDDDEFGTLNYVTPDVRRSAAALVTEGRAVSMARPLDTHASPANP